MGERNSEGGPMSARIAARWTAVGTTGIVLAVTALMVLGSTAGGAVVPPFKGTVSKTNSVYWYGCATPKLVHKVTFSLQTGKAGFAGTDSTAACAKSMYGVNAQSYADTNGMFSAEIPIKVSGGSTNVSMNFRWSESWTSSITWSGACPTKSYFIQDPTNASQDRNLTSGDCDISSVVDTGGNAVLVDETNGTQFDETGSLGCGVTCIFSTYNDTENFTGIYYGCTGPASAPTSCFNANSTYQTSNKTTSSTTSGGTGSWWFSSTGPSSCPGCNVGWTYNPHHKYVLFVDLLMDANSAVTNWRHGSAKTDFNMDSAGNGFTLTSIGVS
jgi:hypothetical protein